MKRRTDEDHVGAGHNYMPEACMSVSGKGDADRELLYHTDYVDIIFDKPNNLLHVCWRRSVKSHEYRDGIEETGRHLLRLDVGKLLVNNQRMGVLTMDDQGWLAKISIEVISKSHLKYLAIVSSTDALQQMTNEVLDKRVKVKAPPFITQYFLSEEDALEWLVAA
ncbi:hypothetical protein [Pontibacter chinhatensis]|uniref:hypothetical protein n=1 Tax=Pontibacter chinhatensis TaxID=1436961 RepID=UPI0011140D01|nr:hypothetical protein [Pontibacter chinhatensis]